MSAESSDSPDSDQPPSTIASPTKVVANSDGEQVDLGDVAPTAVPTLCPMVEEGQTPYRQRFGEDYKGPLYSFGAKIQYKPSNEDDLDDMPRIGTKLRPGIFVGYDQRSGGGLDWGLTGPGLASNGVSSRRMGSTSTQGQPQGSVA